MKNNEKQKLVRDTSIEAYRKVQESGYVARWNRLVYNTFYEHGPLTSAECYELMNVGLSDQCGNVRARVHENRKMDILQELGKRECSVKGNTVYYYDVTDREPKKIVKEKSVKIKCNHCKGKGHIDQVTV